MSENTLDYSKQLKNLLELQDSLNKVVNDNWVELNREWYRAIWTEAAELIDHLSWKWWKKNDPDYNQAKMELVDILHFGLSDIIVKQGISEDSIKELSKLVSSAILLNTTGDSSQEVQRQAVENFAAQVIMTKSFDIHSFFRLTDLFNYSFKDIYFDYIGKNVLNKFRQDNGYKTGEYKKIWDGREDNVHLTEIIKMIKEADYVINVGGIIYQALNNRYEEELTKDVPA